MQDRQNRVGKPRSRRSKDFPADAKAAALRLIAYRARSRKELADRLAIKGFSPSDVETTINLLEEKGLIDDEKLAPELVRFASERKFLGKGGIRIYLKRRGLESSVIDESLSEYDEDSEIETASALVAKKLRMMSGICDDRRQRRLREMLRRRGYSQRVIRKVIPVERRT